MILLRPRLSLGLTGSFNSAFDHGSRTVLVIKGIFERHKLPGAPIHVDMREREVFEQSVPEKLKPAVTSILGNTQESSREEFKHALYGLGMTEPHSSTPEGSSTLSRLSVTTPAGSAAPSSHISKPQKGALNGR